jgi:hypothetical protein
MMRMHNDYFRIQAEYRRISPANVSTLYPQAIGIPPGARISPIRSCTTLGAPNAPSAQHDNHFTRSVASIEQVEAGEVRRRPSAEFFEPLILALVVSVFPAFRIGRLRRRFQFDKGARGLSLPFEYNIGATEEAAGHVRWLRPDYQRLRFERARDAG